MKRYVYPVLATLLLALLASPVAAAENWPQVRGPTGDGHAQATNLPVTWSETENVRWKTAIAGRGWSSPVVWENQIWMTTASPDGHEMSAVCVDFNSGKILHEIKLFENDQPREIHSLNSYASPTPAIEQGRVYIHFGSYGTACLDTQTGKTLWVRRDLECNHYRGPGSSPILYGNLLITHYDGFDYQYIVALNKQTGETVWRRNRDIDYGTDNGDFKKAYCTPIVIEVDGQPQLVSPTSKATIAYNPATGEEIWRVRYTQFSSTARPLYGQGLVFINTGFGKAELHAVKPTGQGDVTTSHVAWIEKKGVPSKTSQLLIDGLLYMVSDDGIATCLEAKSGEKVWQTRLGGKYSASPIYADGRIYVFDHEGKGAVLAPGREFQQLAENTLDDGCMASPAAIGSALIVRTRSHLYRIEKE